jgi:hypothetical protein
MMLTLAFDPMWGVAFEALGASPAMLIEWLLSAVLSAIVLAEADGQMGENGTGGDKEECFRCMGRNF